VGAYKIVVTLTESPTTIEEFTPPQRMSTGNSWPGLRSLPATTLRALTTVLALLYLCGCARTLLPSPEAAFREISAPPLNDDLELGGLIEAIEAQRATLLRTSSKVMQFGPETITRGAYVEALDRLLVTLRSQATPEAKLAYIRDNFRFFEIYGGKKWGDILLTSYFEPVIPGSLKKTAVYSQPLYAKPADLVSIELSQFAERFRQEGLLKGRVFNDRVFPYFSREDIDGKNVLAGRALELCYVDPVDAFFLHIQGSGTVRLPDGSEIYLNYAEKNGLKYEAVGKFLREQLAPLPITMQRVESTLRSMNETERNRILFRNPSYVFFRKNSERAITSLGVPATPGRTIAADPKFAPKGALALLSFPKPVFAPGDEHRADPSYKQDVSRIVLDQDSGGAITGTARIDLFWGRGDEAKRHAGVVQERARIVYLMPRAVEGSS
jgi:membrane-bound lytic murein transglycosylase A